MQSVIKTSVEEVLRPCYDRQVEKFSFDVAIEMLGQKDLDAAEAAIVSRFSGDPAGRTVRVRCESMEQLRRLKKYVKVLGRMAAIEGLKRIDLQYGDRKFSASPGMAVSQQRKVTMNPVIALPLPGIQIAQMQLSRPLLEVMMEFIENPEWRCGVVSLKDQHQVIITKSSAQMILGADYDRLMSGGQEEEARSRLAAATNLKREDYFYLPDLEDFMQSTRQQLTVNDRDSEIELSWRGRDRSGAWKQFTQRTRLISDGGEVYHVARNIDVVDIREPVAV